MCHGKNKPKRKETKAMKNDNAYLAIEALEEAYATLKNAIYDLDPEDDTALSMEAHRTLIDALENLAVSTLALERKL